jgi:hypothetical protein
MCCGWPRATRGRRERLVFGSRGARTGPARRGVVSSWMSPGAPSGRPPRCRGPAREHPAGPAAPEQPAQVVDRDDGRIDPVMQAGRHQQEVVLVARAECLRAHTRFSHPGRAPGWRLPTRAPKGVPASRQPTDASETYVSDLRAAFGWESLPDHRRYCQGGTERSGATAITITRLAVAGRTVAGGRADRWHCLGSG